MKREADIMKLFMLPLCINIIWASPTPIVLYHGMGDTCCFPFSMGRFTKILEDRIPGVYVHSIMVGESSVEDFTNSYFMNANKQIKMVCEQLASDPKLKDGFHAVGFSQGSQFLRAVIQRCGHTLPPVKNYISIAGQHQGIYGLPDCGSLRHRACDDMRKLLNYAAYVSWVQTGLIQATYWHDPLDEKTYSAKSILLADINNEKVINQTYIDNLKKVEHFVMVKFLNDTVVQPVDSEWFAFYKPGQSKVMQTLQESDIYIQDRLGLKAMDKNKQLIFLASQGNHLQFPEGWFESNLLQYLV